MKVWIDALTPKQALFFNVVRDWLKNDGHEVFSTTRAGYGGHELGSIVNYYLEVVGKHGLAPFEKLVESSRRIQALSKIIYDGCFDLALSFSSPECARVSFGLGIPHINFSDSPHAVHASKLTVPLSRLLFTPWIIPTNVWTKYGIEAKNVIHYRAIDASIWLRNWHFRDMKKELGLEKRLTITIRMHEEYASYLLGKGGNVLGFVREIVNQYADKANIIILSRYQSGNSNLKTEFGDDITLIDSAVDGPSLIKSSDVFVGMGGTMTHEAALLGVPAISAYPGKTTLIEEFLIKKKLIFKYDNVDAFMKFLSFVCCDDDWRIKYKKRSHEFWNSLEDPREKIISKIETIGKKV
jgi:predicted glycosyltransferase